LLRSSPIFKTGMRDGGPRLTETVLVEGRFPRDELWDE
jgi:hypothetical protein